MTVNLSMRLKWSESTVSWWKGLLARNSNVDVTPGYSSHACHADFLHAFPVEGGSTLHRAIPMCRPPSMTTYACSPWEAGHFHWTILAKSKKKLVNGDDRDLIWVEKGYSLPQDIHAVFHHYWACCFLVEQGKLSAVKAGGSSSIWVEAWYAAQVTVSLEETDPSSNFPREYSTHRSSLAPLQPYNFPFLSLEKLGRLLY